MATFRSLLLPLQAEIFCSRLLASKRSHNFISLCELFRTLAIHQFNFPRSYLLILKFSETFLKFSRAFLKFTCFQNLLVQKIRKILKLVHFFGFFWNLFKLFGKLYLPRIFIWKFYFELFDIFYISKILKAFPKPIDFRKASF